MPYALLGPGFVLDDWFALANARFDGWWMAAGHDQWLARPGAGAVYALVFGVIGERPSVVYAVSAVVFVATAIVLRRLLVDMAVDRVVAFAVACVWVVLPNHGSLLFWPSATNIAVALLWLLCGWRALVHRRALVAAGLLAASVLCYEATAPVAIVGVLWLARRRWRDAAPSLVAVAGAGAWVVAFFHPDKVPLDRWADLTLVVPGHAGWGVLSPNWLATVGGIAFAVGVTLVLVRGGQDDRQLIVIGLAVIGLGTLPFVRYYYAPLGAGDRVNVVAAVGTAIAWTALARAAITRSRAGVAACAVLAVGALLAQWDAARAWSAAADDGRRVLATIEARPGEVVVVDAPPVRRNVAAFLDRSNIRSAVQLRAGTRDVGATMRRAR